MIDRLLVSRGPAMITHRGGVFFTRADLVVELNKGTTPIPSAAFGELTQINQGVKAIAKFRPIGEFEHLGVLWPYANTPIGRSIFGDADYPLLIQPLDTTQKQTRFKAAGLSKMPDLNFTATDTLIGDCEFQMVGANGAAPNDPARLFVLENNTIDLATLPYDDAALIVQAYGLSWLSQGTYLPSYNGNAATGGAIAYNVDAAALQTKLRTITALAACTVTGDYKTGFTVTDAAGLDPALFTAVLTSFPGGSALKATAIDADNVRLQLAPWSDFETRAGVKVTFALTLTEDTGDAIGHYDTVFGGLSVTAAGLPQVSEAAMLAAALVQGAGSVRGSRLSVGAHDLDVIGEGVYFRLYAAQLRKAGQIFSATNQRVPDLEWVASRTVGGGGVLNPLFYIGERAPA